MQAQELLQQGQVDECLEKLQEEIRKNPSDAKSRVFLFQLLSVMGQWERAITQLNVAAELDPINMPMAQMCRGALNSEALRADIFAGKRSPVIFGEPDEWVSWMIQANQLLADGHHSQSQELRDKALEAAPAVSGKIDGHAFEWIADADPRMGPILEAVINGRYYWVPMARVHEIKIDKPSDLRDLVWIPSQIKWTNGGESIALIPVRYPGSHASEDDQIRLARKTDWVDQGGDISLGLGQRLLATDEADYALLDTRHILFDNEVEGDGDEAVDRSEDEASSSDQESADG